MYFYLLFLYFLQRKLLKMSLPGVREPCRVSEKNFSFKKPRTHTKNPTYPLFRYFQLPSIFFFPLRKKVNKKNSQKKLGFSRRPGPKKKYTRESETRKKNTKDRTKNKI